MGRDGSSVGGLSTLWAPNSPAACSHPPVHALSSSFMLLLVVCPCQFIRFTKALSSIQDDKASGGRPAVVPRLPEPTNATAVGVDVGVGRSGGSHPQAHGSSGMAANGFDGSVQYGYGGSGKRRRVVGGGNDDSSLSAPLPRAMLLHGTGGQLLGVGSRAGSLPHALPSQLTPRSLDGVRRGVGVSSEHGSGSQLVCVQRGGAVRGLVWWQRDVCRVSCFFRSPVPCCRRRHLALRTAAPAGLLCTWFALFIVGALVVLCCVASTETHVLARRWGQHGVN